MRTSKIRGLDDDHGRPVAYALTPGNVAGISMALPLLGARSKPKRLIGDKAYDMDSLRRLLKGAPHQGGHSRTVPYPLDRTVYR